MRQKIITTYAEAMSRRPWLVLIACLVLAGAAGWTFTRMEFRTARSALESADNPDEARFTEYLKEFGPNLVVAVVEGGTERERQAFVEDFAARLREDRAMIQDVIYRIPVDFFREHLLALAPGEDLRMMAEALEKEAGTLKALGEAKGLADVHRVIAARIQAEFRQGGSRIPPEAAKGLEEVAGVIDDERRFLEEPARTAAEITGRGILDLVGVFRPEEADRFAHGGFICSPDGLLYVVQIQPVVEADAPGPLKKLLAAIRSAAGAARQGRPGITYGLVGLPVTIVEESDTVGRDTPFCSGVAVAGIAVLVAVAFRRKRNVLLVLLALGIGILWTFGVAWAAFGGINMITAAVPVILLALGIDFGVHVISGYEAERARGSSPGPAIVATLSRVGPGLGTSAVTTALAFFAICFMEYRGFREFGAIAGLGVLVCLAAMVTVLPALLVLTDRRPDRPGNAAFAPLVEELVEEPPDIPPPTSRLGRTWHRICRSATAVPWLTIAIAAGATAYFAYLAHGIGFDYRVEDLLPAQSESLRTEAKLKRCPDLTPEFGAVLTRSPREVAAAIERARGLPQIKRWQSILDLVPDEPPAERAAVLAKIRALLAALAIDPSRLGPVDREDLAKSLEDLSGVFGKALDKVGGIQGAEALARALDRVGNALDASAEFVRKAPAGWEAAFSAAQDSLWKWARDRKAEIDAELTRGPVTEKDVPPEILDNFKSPLSGRYMLYLYPAEDLADRAALARFVEACRKVDPAATGYPVVFFASTNLIHQGFATAVLAAAVVILVTLFIDFRRPIRVFLATIPKLIGIVWMLGIMRVLGINYNLANQIVIPLIIGVGLSYGIHIIHRFFQGPREDRNITRVLEQTGAAIVLSGLTTMIGFGSLGLASYRGLASMGQVLFFGVGSALVASTYILANLLVLIYRPKR